MDASLTLPVATFIRSLSFPPSKPTLYLRTKCLAHAFISLRFACFLCMLTLAPLPLLLPRSLARMLAIELCPRRLTTTVTATSLPLCPLGGRGVFLLPFGTTESSSCASHTAPSEDTGLPLHVFCLFTPLSVLLRNRLAPALRCPRCSLGNLYSCCCVVSEEFHPTAFGHPFPF